MGSSGDSSSDNVVQQVADLLLTPGTEYLRRIEDSSLLQTLSEDEEHVQDLIRDEPVKVDIPPNVRISAELLGEVGIFSKRSIPYRKLDVTYFSQSGLFVREVAASVRHGDGISLGHYRFAMNSVLAQTTPLPLMSPLCQRGKIRPPSCLQSCLLKLKMTIVVFLHLFVTVLRSWRTSPMHFQ